MFCKTTLVAVALGLVVAANPIPEEPFEEYRPSKNVLEVKTYPGLVRVSSTFQLYDAFSDHPCCRLLV